MCIYKFKWLWWWFERYIYFYDQVYRQRDFSKHHGKNKTLVSSSWWLASFAVFSSAASFFIPFSSSIFQDSVTVLSTRVLGYPFSMKTIRRCAWWIRPERIPSLQFVDWFDLQWKYLCVCVSFRVYIHVHMYTYTCMY